MILKDRRSRIFPTLQGPEYSKTPDLVAVVSLPPGNAGIKKTLEFMEHYAESYSHSPRVRGLVLQLTRNLKQKDFAAEIRALFDFVKYRIRYVHDTAGKELLQTPDKTLEFGQGDCDDKSILLASMLKSIGYTTNFKAIGVNGSALCHVFVQVKQKDSGNWLSLDPTENHPAGWHPPGITSELNSNPQLNGFFSKVVKTIRKDVSKVAKAGTGVVKATGNVAKTVVKTGGKVASDVAHGQVRKAVGDTARGTRKAIGAGWQGQHGVISTALQVSKDVRKTITPKPVLNAENKIVDAAARALNSKAGHLLTTVMTFFPLSAPFAFAMDVVQAGQLVAMAEGMRKKVSQLKSDQQKWLQGQMSGLNYVQDPKTKKIRRSRGTAADNALPQFRFDASTNSFQLVQTSSVPDSVAAATTPPISSGDVAAGQQDAGDIAQADIQDDSMPESMLPDIGDSGFADSSQYTADAGDVSQNADGAMGTDSTDQVGSTLDKTGKIVNTVIGLATLASLFAK